MATEVLASYDKSGNLDAETLKPNIETHTGGTAILSDATNGFPVTAVVDGYTFTINSDGDIIKGKVVTWAQEGTKITGSDGAVVNVGDIITGYDPTNGVSKSSETSNQNDNGYEDRTYKISDFTGGWIVLGADEESGQLIITTDDVIKAEGSKTLELNGGKGYVNGIQELDKISKLYGQGKYADESKTRSINVDDINNVTGYDPTKEGNVEKTPYGKGNVWQYENEVTYSWETYQSEVSYSSSVTNGSDSYSEFQYLDAQGNPVNLGENDSQKFTSTYYFYYPQSLTADNSDGVGTVKEGTNAYKALFQNSSGTNVAYWLGSQCVDATVGYVNFGLRIVEGRRSRELWLLILFLPRYWQQRL